MSFCKSNYNPTSTSARTNLAGALDLSGPLEAEYGELFDRLDEIQRASDADTTATRRIEIEEATKTVNITLRDALANNPDEVQSTLPHLKNRLDKVTFITPIEIQEFASAYFFDPAEIPEFLYYPQSGEPEERSKDFLEKLNDFFLPGSNSDLTMGSFCALVPSIFAGIDQFVQFFNNVSAIADKISSVIGNIRDLGIAGLISKLEDQITSVINNIVAQVKKQIDNIKNFFQRKIQDFRDTHTRIMNKVQKEVDRVDTFFSEENIERIKKQVKGLISYAVGLFEDPSIEEIEFIVYRFCKFATQMESRMFGILGPVSAMVDDYDSTYTTLKTSSEVNQAMASRAGAIRYDVEAQRQGRVSSSSPVQAAGRYNPITIDEYNEIIPWNNGNGIPGRVVFPHKLGGMGREGYDKLQDEVKIYLSRLQKAFGRELRINSAYRSPSYNRSVGGATSSMHMSGGAIDITFDGINNRAVQEDFLRYAFEAGFEWHKIYNTFIHVDNKKRGNPRSNLSYIFGERQGLITATPERLVDSQSPDSGGWVRGNGGRTIEV